MSRFGSANRLASWAGMCPGNDKTAGTHFPARRARDQSGCAPHWSNVHGPRSKDSSLRAQYARIKGRHEHNKKAIVAVARSILVIAYHVLLKSEPYRELGADYLHRAQSQGSLPTAPA
jgi:transposase